MLSNREIDYIAELAKRHYCTTKTLEEACKNETLIVIPDFLLGYSTGDNHTYDYLYKTLCNSIRAEMPKQGFQVGDKVTLTLTGTLHRFEQAEGEDGCYTIYLEDDIYKGNDYTTRVYLYASTLEKMGAKKVND